MTFLYWYCGIGLVVSIIYQAVTRMPGPRVRTLEGQVYILLSWPFLLWSLVYFLHSSFSITRLVNRPASTFILCICMGMGIATMITSALNLNQW